jgi:hypothetical protein
VLLDWVLPVSSIVSVTVCCTGRLTVTSGGGGGTYVLSRPQPASSASNAATAKPELRRGDCPDCALSCPAIGG